MEELTIEQIREKTLASLRANIVSGPRVAITPKIQFGAIGKGTSCSVIVTHTSESKAASNGTRYHFRTCVLESDEDVVVKFKRGKNQADTYLISTNTDYVIPRGTLFNVQEWGPKFVIGDNTPATINGLCFQTYKHEDGVVSLKLYGSFVPLQSDDTKFVARAEFLTPHKDDVLLQRHRAMVAKLIGVQIHKEAVQQENDDNNGLVIPPEEEKKVYEEFYHRKPYRFIVDNHFTLPSTEDELVVWAEPKRMIASLAPGQELFYYTTLAAEDLLPEARKKKTMGLSGGESKKDPVQFILHQTDGRGVYKCASVWLRLYDNNLNGLLLHPESDIGDWLAFAPQIVSGLAFKFIGDVKDDLMYQGDFSGFSCAVRMSGSVGIDLKKTLENGATLSDPQRVVDYLAMRKGLTPNGNLENGTYTYAQLQDILPDQSCVCCLTNIKGVNISGLLGECKFYEYKKGSTMLIYAVTNDGSPIKPLINEMVEEEDEPVSAPAEAPPTKKSKQ